MPQKQRPPGRLWLHDGSCVGLRPERPNHVWSYDFVSDRTEDGRRLRRLTLMDESRRECLALPVERRIGHLHCLLSFFDPLLRCPPFVVKPYHSSTRKRQVRHHEPDSRVQLSQMMLYLHHHPSGRLPSGCLVQKTLVFHQGLFAGPSHWARHHRWSDLRVQSGGEEATFSGQSNIVHFDLLFHSQPRGSKVRPFFAVGGGLKTFQGTGGGKGLSASQPICSAH